MSEYQYYEFRAVDRELTRQEMGVLRRLSSRAKITPMGFSVVYHFSDLSRHPVELLGQYFDAFVYLANWGSRHFMVRVPRRFVELERVAEYETPPCMELIDAEDNVILAIRSDDEEAGGWVENGEGWMDELLPIRGAILEGDLRALYLGWLVGVQLGHVEDDAVEPVVPPGLGELDESLEQLVEFLNLDRDLVTAAAERSEPMVDRDLSREDIRSWLERLPPGERIQLLVSFVAGDDPHLARDVRHRIRQSVMGEAEPGRGPGRTAGQLRARALEVAQERRRREEEERAERRRRYLESLRNRSDELWQRATELAEKGNRRSYEQATQILCDLRDLAEMDGQRRAFDARVRDFVARHERRRKLMARLREEGLVPSDEG